MLVDKGTHLLMFNKEHTQHKIIFISGRFRSGTSMLWHIFNQLPEYCAWYEPLHPNLISHIQHVKPQKDHIGISDYWQNYRHLSELDNYHCKSFGQSRLSLENHNQWPELVKYINYLIGQSSEKVAVLQFNRMDLRLGWLKNHFPEALIINIERSPYPLWVSSRKHINDEQQRNNESFQDAYDLMQWSVNLSKAFPMLQKKDNRNAYYRHYFIWKLSQLMAKANAHLFLQLEQHFFNSNKGIKMLSNLLDWDNDTCAQVQKLIRQPDSLKTLPEKPPAFDRMESDIDNLFKATGLAKYFPSTPLSSIKIDHSSAWSKYLYNDQLAIDELMHAINLQKDELTAMANS